MLLFRHTHDTANGLYSELVALQLTEYKQNGSARAVPTQSDGFFEKQNLGQIVGFLQIGQIFFFVCQPYRQTVVVGSNAAHHFKILLYLIGYGSIFRRHIFLGVIRQLNE